MTDTDPPTGARFADLDWSEQGVPRSRRFDDVYYSTGGGPDESRHVFLEGNALAGRWRELAGDDRFLVGETGFGTGLNFLTAWELWNRAAPESAQLEFLSTEAWPLAPGDLRRAHAAWPELAPLAEQLQAHYPRCLHPGVHRLQLVPGRVSLTLMIGDATAGLEDCLDSAHPAHQRFSPGINAWFLDGFAPARNPEMWRPGLFAAVQALSARDATVATFTAAGDVRRGLEAHGFQVSKHPGFGRKRDMLRARLVEVRRCPPTSSFPPSPRAGDHPLAWDVSPAGQRPAPGRDPVLVIGAGLAGCHAARALAERGLNVLVLDRAQQPASGGSGNAQGVLYAKPAARGGAASDFNLAALQFAERHYRRFWNGTLASREPGGTAGQDCGVLHLARDEADAQRQQALLERWPQQTLFRTLDAQAASEVAGVALGRPGLWFPGSGWLAPPVLCAELLDHERIELRQAGVAQLRRDGDRWQVLDDTGAAIASSTHVVLACALGLRGLLPGGGLPVQAVRGQLSRLALQDDEPAMGLRIALCGDGYVTPPLDRQLYFGASFVPNDEATGLRPAEHEDNLRRLETQVPGLLRQERSADQLEGRAALRCATPDRLPMVGPVPDNEAMAARFAVLGKNADASLAEPGAFLEGLYTSAGYGSRGLAYIPLATELLCWHLLGGAPPLSRELRTALHPARFLIRDIIRGKR